MLALPLLAGCAYDSGYYGPAYDNGYGYGYGGYGYGYGYGYYGNPCWPYGCNGWGHRRHHHWDDDDGDNGTHHNHHYNHGSGVGMNRPSGGPGYSGGNGGAVGVNDPPGAGHSGRPRGGAQTPKVYFWPGQARDSKQ
jgi:hypothetical protein